jgi:PAS domain S-box-containing protein
MRHQSSSALPNYAEIMLAHLPIGAALFDARDFRLLAANPSFHASLDPEWQDGKAIGHVLTDFIPYTKESKSIDVFQRVATTGVAYQIDTYASRAFVRGTTYWNWSLNPHCNDAGEVTHLLLTLNEVTSQVQVQQEAEQTRATLQQTNLTLEAEQQRMALLEGIAHRIGGLLQPERIASTALDVINAAFKPLASVIYAADAAQECFRALALYLPDSDAALQHHVSFLPYDRSSFLARALQERSSILHPWPANFKQGPEKGMIAHLVPEAKTMLCIPMWYNDFCEGALVIAFAQPPSELISSMQSIEGCVPLLAEALASARLHMVIEHERQRLHTILDQLPEGILLVEATTGTISYANPVASLLLGIHHESLLGASLNQLEPKRTRSENSTLPWNFALIHALWGKTVSSQELVVRRPDGSQAILLSSTAPIRLDTGGNISEAVIAFQDITVQKTAEQQKIDFLTMVNHELRTPLTAVLGFSDILREQGMEGLNPLQTTAISSIVEQSEYLHYLVNEILDQSYFERATFELHLIQQDLLPLLYRLVDYYTRTNKGYQIELKIERFFPHAKLMGNFDAHRLAQVFNNVLTNAVKYSSVGSVIEVGGRPFDANDSERAGILLWIKDQGPGIAAEDIPHIFERFYRAKNRDYSVGGLGLGLYLAKEFMQSHGGRIWVESTEGVGSTFFFSLPFISLLSSNVVD